MQRFKMTSIHTNAGAISALQTLRSIGSDMDATQGRISSGLRIGNASDNAAYWSIATTMRSDNRAIATVDDNLGLAAAKIDISYSAMSAVKDVLDEVKAKLVAASEPGVDKAKIQKEIDQLAQSTRDIADSASFAGQNWLSTDIPSLIDTTPPKRSSTLVSSFNRSATGSLSIGTTTIDHLSTALFNKDGGGILQPDPRSPKSIAGIRSDWSMIPIGDPWYSPTGYNDYKFIHGPAGGLEFTFAGPLDFSSAGDTITFDLTLDAEDPGSLIPGPYALGNTYAVTIDRSVVDNALPSNGGVINTRFELASVLNSVLGPMGAYAIAASSNNTSYDKFHIITRENNGLYGSAVQISNLASTVGTGGLQNGLDYGDRGSTLNLPFEAFEVYESVEITFDFHFNEEAPTSHVIDRTLVNSVLGTTDGKIETSAQWAQILNTLITRPDTIIAATSANNVNVKTDSNVDRLNGYQSGVYFMNVAVNIEPIPQTGIFEIDIVSNPDKLDKYIVDVDLMTKRTVDGAATLGAIKARVEMQSDFTKALMDTIDKGIGRLVDADMNEESTRLKALQTQQQLGIQALQIANSNSENVMTLFR